MTLKVKRSQVAAKSRWGGQFPRSRVPAKVDRKHYAVYHELKRLPGQDCCDVD